MTHSTQIIKTTAAAIIMLSVIGLAPVSANATADPSAANTPIKTTSMESRKGENDPFMSYKAGQQETRKGENDPFLSLRSRG